MNLIAHKLIPDEGKIIWDQNKTFSYLDQHLEVKDDTTIYEYLYNVYQELFEKENEMNELYSSLAEAEEKNYDKILNTPTEQEITTPLPTPQENPIITPTEVKDESCAPEVNTQPLPIIELLPPTPLTAPEVMNEESAPQIEIKPNIDLRGIFSENKTLSPKSDISISTEKKVSEIAQNYPLNEDEQNTLNLAYTKDSNNIINNENNEDMEQVRIGVIDNILSAFTPEEVTRWREYLTNDEVEKFTSEARNKVAELRIKYRIKEEAYMWQLLFNHVTTEQPTPTVEENHDDTDLEQIPSWIWDTLVKVYTIQVKEKEIDRWGDEVEVINKYLKPMDVIRALYRNTLSKYSPEDKALFNKYAKVVYDDCAFTYKEYDKEITEITN
jgi:hypothetical protein